MGAPPGRRAGRASPRPSCPRPTTTRCASSPSTAPRGWSSRSRSCPARPASRTARRGVAVLWDRGGGPAGFRCAATWRPPSTTTLAPIDERMGHHERLRLLYVACTRARDHLVVSLHREEPKPDADEQRWTAAQLLAAAADERAQPRGAVACRALRCRREAAASGAVLPRPATSPISATWEAAREAAMRCGRRPDVVAATGVAALVPAGSRRARRARPPAWRSRHVTWSCRRG